MGIQRDASKMEGIKILLLALSGSIVYGVLHDLVTAHQCVQYFSEFHPDLFHTTNPIFLALGWGVVATWWAGALIGIPLAMTSTLGNEPKLGWRALLFPVGVLLLTMGLFALLAGLFGRQNPEAILDFMPKARRFTDGRTLDFTSRFASDLAAHNASYLAGLVGGCGLWVYAGIARLRLSSNPQGSK